MMGVRSMNPAPVRAQSSLATRRSLLSRLKESNAQESWRQFFDTYWKLIYGTAVKSGLSEAEAQDAVRRAEEELVEARKALASAEAVAASLKKIVEARAAAAERAAERLRKAQQGGR